MAFSIAKLCFFLMLWFIIGIFIIPTFFKRTRLLMNEETLLIVSLGLCLLMVVAATQVGFSSALGAFVMGSILAETMEAEKIGHLVKPVKDLFAAIFFVSVGMMVDPGMIWEYIGNSRNRGNIKKPATLPVSVRNMKLRYEKRAAFRLLLIYTI